MKCKSLNPADRMGVYKCIEDVPQRYRLGEYADQYTAEMSGRSSVTNMSISKVPTITTK